MPHQRRIAGGRLVEGRRAQRYLSARYLALPVAAGDDGYRLAAFGVGRAGQDVVDVGTGTGTLVRGFARRGCRVVDIDPPRNAGPGAPA